MTDSNLHENVKNAKISLQYGDYKKSLAYLEAAKQQGRPNNLDVSCLFDRVNYVKKEEVIGKQYMQRKDYRKALSHLKNVLDEVTQCQRVNFLQAECLTFINCLEDAKRLLPSDNIEDNKDNDFKVNLLYIQALMKYFKGNVEKALTLTTLAMDIDRRNEKLNELHYKLQEIKDDLSEAQKSNDANEFQKAQVTYSNLIKKIEKENTSLLCNIYTKRTEVSLKLHAYIDAASDAKRIIQLDGTRKEGYLYSAEACIHWRKLDVAIEDVERGVPFCKNQNNIECLNQRLEEIKKIKNLYELTEKLKDPQSKVEREKIPSALKASELENFSSSACKELAAEIQQMLSKHQEENDEGLRDHVDNPDLNEYPKVLEMCQKFKYEPRKIFGLPLEAEDENVLQKIREMMKKYHPDNGKGEEYVIMSQITEILLEIRKDLQKKIRTAAKNK